MDNQEEKKVVSRAYGKIILAGNPNVGKSVIFNRLTGKYVTVSNYPGTTVDVTQGSGVFGGNGLTVIDTPGANDLIPSSEDERVTRDVVFNEFPKCVVQVADLKNLRRTVMFALQLAELGVPLIIVLNMADEAAERGINVDAKKLSEIIGSPVIKTIGITGEGISKLKEAIAAGGAIPSYVPKYNEKFERTIVEITKNIPAGFPHKRSLAVMLLAGDESAYGFVEREKTAAIREAIEFIKKKFFKPLSVVLLEERQKAAEQIVRLVLKEQVRPRRNWEESLGNALVRPFPGIPAALLALLLMYEFVGVFGAGTCVKFLEEFLFGKLINPLTVKALGALGLPPFFYDIIAGQYGLVTMALTYALAIIFPIVTTFFIFFGMLEDSGYLPRLSVMLDRAFRLIGLNGRAVLPIVLGLGCGTMATLTTRILETKKERLMVTFLLALGVPCSAQLGVIIAMLGSVSLKYTLAWLAIVSFNLLLAGWLLDKIVKGKRMPFLIEIPPVRVPQLKNILVKVRVRIVWYLKEAVPLFILGTLLLFLLDKTGALAVIEKVMRPVVYNLLGLPPESAFAFIIGFLRRDYGAAGFYTLQKAGALAPSQVLIAVVVITLFIPCIAQYFMMVKERGYKTATLIAVFIVMYAVVVGAALNSALNFLKGLA